MPTNAPTVDADKPDEASIVTDEKKHSEKPAKGDETADGEGADGVDKPPRFRVSAA